MCRIKIRFEIILTDKNLTNELKVMHIFIDLPYFFFGFLIDLGFFLLTNPHQLIINFVDFRVHIKQSLKNEKNSTQYYNDKWPN